MSTPKLPPHSLFNVQLGRNERWLLRTAASPTALFGYVIDAPDRSTREGLRRAAKKLRLRQPVVVRRMRVYTRARDPRREGLIYQSGRFWTRPDASRAHAVRRNVVWRSEFGEQILRRYRFELTHKRPIRWDPDSVALAHRVAQWRGGDPHIEDALEQLEHEAHDAALFGDRPSLQLALAIPAEVLTPDDRNRWALASLLAGHRSHSAKPESIWDDARVLFAELNLPTLREAVKNDMPWLAKDPSKAELFRRRRVSRLR